MTLACDSSKFLHDVIQGHKWVRIPLGRPFPYCHPERSRGISQRYTAVLRAALLATLHGAFESGRTGN